MTTAANHHMPPDIAWCHRCGVETNWKPVRGGKRLACEGCGDKFPCSRPCVHIDCAEARNDHHHSDT